jgi:hypothetical protein
MKAAILIGIRDEEHLKWVQIKRGTLVEEFLYELRAFKSFVLAEGELHQDAVKEKYEFILF